MKDKGSSPLSKMVMSLHIGKIAWCSLVQDKTTIEFGHTQDCGDDFRRAIDAPTIMQNQFGCSHSQLTIHRGYMVATPTVHVLLRKH